MCDKKCSAVKTAQSKIEDILEEVAGELECWECWSEEQYGKRPEDCNCQTCQLKGMYNTLVTIAEG